MNLLSIVFLISFVIVMAIAVAGLRQPAGTPARTLATVGVCFLLIGLAVFSAFGFFASGELAPDARWRWQAGYAVLGAGCVAAAVLLARRERRKS